MLPPPEQLIASLGPSGVTLGWVPVPGAAGYRVERGESRSGEWETVGGNVRVAQFLDPHPLEGMWAWYRVAAIDGDGTSGAVSPPVRVSLLPLIVVGGALAQSANDRRDASGLTATDLFKAGDLWRHTVPAPYAGLLAAAIIDSANWRGPGWAFDRTNQQYISPNGTRLSDENAHRLAILFFDAASHRLRDDAVAMTAGKTPLAEWQSNMQQSVRSIHAAAVALGVGGLSGVTADMLADASGGGTSGVSFSIDRLSRFASAVSVAAARADNTPDIVERAGAYANAAYPAVEQSRTWSHAASVDASGRKLFLFERNRLGEAQHCQSDGVTPGCINETMRGWQPIGTLSRPGDRTCGFMCRCRIEYVLAPPSP